MSTISNPGSRAVGQNKVETKVKQLNKATIILLSLLLKNLFKLSGFKLFEFDT